MINNVGYSRNRDFDKLLLVGGLRPRWQVEMTATNWPPLASIVNLLVSFDLHWELTDHRPIINDDYHTINYGIDLRHCIFGDTSRLPQLTTTPNETLPTGSIEHAPLFPCNNVSACPSICLLVFLSRCTLSFAPVCVYVCAYLCLSDCLDVSNFWCLCLTVVVSLCMSIWLSRLCLVLCLYVRHFLRSCYFRLKQSPSNLAYPWQRILSDR